MKTLIVDDASYMRLKLRELLEMNNCTVVGEAENGADAIVKYFELKPDFVTMDIIMPVMDGITAIEKIIEKDPRANIVVVSSKGQKELILDAIKKGAKDYFVKPFQNEGLVVVINKMQRRVNR